MQSAKTCSKSMRRATGFTLIELLIGVAIVAILSTIALPSYVQYTKKQKIRSAQTDLIGLVLNMESYYALGSPNAYPTPTTTTEDTKNIFNGAWSPAQSNDFIFEITRSTSGSYGLSAIGSSSTLSGCTITIDSTNNRALSAGCGGSTAWY